MLPCELYFADQYLANGQIPATVLLTCAASPQHHPLVYDTIELVAFDNCEAELLVTCDGAREISSYK